MPTVVHTCHAHGCDTIVKEKRLMCWSHWSKLPRNIQDAVWREYRPGQEVDKKPSLRYLAVQRLAISHAAFKPNDEAAAMTVATYLQEALEGLVPA
jgi:hypothetical protein